MARLAEVLRGPDDLELRRAFTAFLRRSLLPARFPGARIPAIQDLEEVRPMLRETVQEWTQQWLEEGRQQGPTERLNHGSRAPDAGLWRARIVYHLCFPIAAGACEERWTTDDSNAEQAIRTFFCQEGGPF